MTAPDSSGPSSSTSSAAASPLCGPTPRGRSALTTDEYQTAEDRCRHPLLPYVPLSPYPGAEPPLHERESHNVGPFFLPPVATPIRRRPCQRTDLAAASHLVCAHGDRHPARREPALDLRSLDVNILVQLVAQRRLRGHLSLPVRFFFFFAHFSQRDTKNPTAGSSPASRRPRTRSRARFSSASHRRRSSARRTSRSSFRPSTSRNSSTRTWTTTSARSSRGARRSRAGSSRSTSTTASSAMRMTGGR